MVQKLVLTLSFLLFFLAGSLSTQTGEVSLSLSSAWAQDEFIDEEEDLEEEISESEEEVDDDSEEDIADSDDDDEGEEDFADNDDDDDEDFGDDDDYEEVADSDEDADGDDGDDDDFDDFDDDDEDKIVAAEEEEDGVEPLAEGAEEPADEMEVAEPTEQPIEQQGGPEIVEESVPTEEVPFEESRVAEAAAESEVDEPDTQLESRLYDIYVNFHSEQTSSEQWDAMVGGKQSEAYAIQPGDTLWGISETLFGDGNYWPKVWSLNGAITNPHLVTPGHSIQFLLGDESEAPAFTVTEAEEKPSEEVAAEPEAPAESAAQKIVVEGGTEQVEIPPPMKVSLPVLMRLPPSLPKWQSQNTGGNYDESGIDYQKRKILDLKDEVPLSAYVVGTPPKSMGKIIEVESGGRLASNYQYVYVAFKRGSAEIGQKLLAVKYERLQSPSATIDGDLGYRVEVQGEIKIVDNLETVIDDADSDLEYFRGMVVRSVNPVRVESELVSGAIQDISVDMQGERSDVVAQVIGSQYDSKGFLDGPQTIVFLNRGSNHGVDKGQVLPVRSNRRVRIPSTVLSENIRPIGYLKVARVERNYSTAIVVRAWDDIQSGDFTGKGKLMATLKQGQDSGDDEYVDDEFEDDEFEDDDELDSDDGDGDDDDLDSEMDMAEDDSEADEGAFVDEGDDEEEDDFDTL